MLAHSLADLSPHSHICDVLHNTVPVLWTTVFITDVMSKWPFPVWAWFHAVNFGKGWNERFYRSLQCLASFPQAVASNCNGHIVFVPGNAPAAAVFHLHAITRLLRHAFKINKSRGWGREEVTGITLLITIKRGSKILTRMIVQTPCNHCREKKMLA